MRPFIIFAALVAGVSSSALRTYGGAELIRSDSYGLVRKEIPITSLTHEIRGSQSDSLSYSTGNGISVSDNTQAVAGRGGLYDDGTGKLVQSDQLIQKSGSFAYTSPEGQPISLQWTADENGFRASGAHLPEPVQLPAELAQAAAEHQQAHAEALSRARAASPSYDSYEQPAVRLSSYNAAPVEIRSSYAAPAVEVVRSSYAPAVRVAEPIVIRSSGY